MAKVFKIEDSVNSVDFLASSAVKLAYDGFSIQTADGLIWTTFDVFGRTTDTSIRATQVALTKLRSDARQYINNPVYDDPVWFYWQSEGETAKRALVYDIVVEILPIGPITPLLGVSNIYFRVAVQHGIWENTTDAGFSASGNISAFGGEAVYNAIDGTADGRIQHIGITSATATDLSQFWIGLLPNRNGVANIVPVWEAEDMTYDNPSEVTTTVDATASGGNYARLDFSAQGDDLQVRFATIMSNHVGNTSYYQQHIGRWLMLMRCRVSDSGTKVKVRTRAGWGPADQASSVASQILNAQTSWRLLEFGELQIPPAGDRDGILASASLGFYQIVVDVQRISGSGNFDFDALCLIPSEHLITADTGVVQIDSDAGSSLDLYTNSNDDQYGHVTSTGAAAIYACNPSFKNWVFPRLGGVIVAAAQPASGNHVVAATLNISTLTVYPRWWLYSNA